MKTRVGEKDLGRERERKREREGEIAASIRIESAHKYFLFDYLLSTS
jgi:hypothetical protein